MTPRVQQFAGLGAFGVCAGLLALYALVAYISTPRHTAGMNSATAAVVYISVGLVVIALIAVHVALGRQLLAAARGTRGPRAARR